MSLDYLTLYNLALPMMECGNVALKGATTQLSRLDAVQNNATMHAAYVIQFCSTSVSLLCCCGCIDVEIVQKFTVVNFCRPSVPIFYFKLETIKSRLTISI